MNGNESNLSTLLTMGFAELQAKKALQSCGGNMEQALDYLLAASSSTGTNPKLSSSNDTMSGLSFDRKIIQCGMSQYDMPVAEVRIAEGKSACTCIALCAAFNFLNAVALNVGLKAEDIITSEFLHRNLLSGVEIYSECKRKQLGSQGTASMEHLSPEEVLLSTSLFSVDMELIGSVKQGLLSSGVNEEENTLGFLAQFTSCRSETECKVSDWLAIVVTKTPETVLVLLPPIGGEGVSEKEESYILVDSHPRPQLSIDGSYAMFHKSLKALAGSLLQIFPPTQMPADVGDVVAMMYNSFDVYALQSRKASKG